ncbi:MAG: HEAT repeat domain-containing protein [Oligoflexia bacterium]|nr:HEAT repeat domain-containing protein [Oligoflexia bacterium]
MSDPVRAALARLLSTREWPDDTDAMDALLALSREGHDIGPAMPELIRRLDSADDFSSQHAAEVLGAVGDPRAIAGLAAAAQVAPHPLPELLGPNPGEAMYAHAVVAHDEENVRRHAVKALGAIGDRRALPFLRVCAADEREEDSIRAAALNAIARIEGTQAAANPPGPAGDSSR